MKQFTEVNSQYGAPMGRVEFGSVKDLLPRSVRLFKVNIDHQGYDDGGAYWGTGQRLYCAEADEYRRFIRASTREDAAKKLRLTNTLLAKPTISPR